MTMNCNNDKNNNKPRYIDFTVAPKPGLWTMWTMFGGWLRRRHAGFVPRWGEWQNTCILWWRIWIFFCFACQFWIAFLFSYFGVRRKFWLLYHRSTTTTTTTTTPTITTTTTPTMTTTSTTSTTRTTAATTSSYVSRCYFFCLFFSWFSQIQWSLRLVSRNRMIPWSISWRMSPKMSLALKINPCSFCDWTFFSNSGAANWKKTYYLSLLLWLRCFGNLKFLSWIKEIIFWQPGVFLSHCWAYTANLTRRLSKD